MFYWTFKYSSTNNKLFYWLLCNKPRLPTWNLHAYSSWDNTGFLNLTLSTIIYPQTHASKAQESFKNTCPDEGKGRTFLFLLWGGWWGELTSSVWAHVCWCTLKWGRHRSKDDPHSPPGPAPDPLAEQWTGDMAAFLGSRRHQTAVPRLLPPRLRLPSPWATQEGQCSCNFLISVYNPQVESTCNQLPCVSGYMQRQVSITIFFVVGISPYVPHCCMPGRAFIISLPCAAELVH